MGSDDYEADSITFENKKNSDFEVDSDFPKIASELF